MAIPTMTPNSPVAGSIAWQAFTIQYMGVAYSIGAGSTAHRWVWWRYNGGGVNSIIEAGPDIPNDLTDDDLVLFGNKNGIPVRIQATSFVDGELLVDGSILTAAIGAGQVTAEKVDGTIITANEVYSQEGYFGTISAAQLMSGTVEADLLLAGTIRTASSGARVENGPGGIVVFNAGGDPVIVLPSNISDANPATFKGEGRFSGLTAEGLTVQGTDNEISAGAVVTLSAGITAPKTSPAIAGDYVYGTTAPPVNNVFRNARYNPTSSKVETVLVDTGAGARYVTFQDYTLNADGTMTPSGSATVSPQLPTGTGARLGYSGIRVGSNYWMICTSTTGNTHYLRKLDGSVDITLASSGINRAPAITTDGTDLYLVWQETSGTNRRWMAERRSAADGSVLDAAYAISAGKPDIDVAYGLYVGNGDFGAKKYVFATSLLSEMQVADHATKVLEPSKQWPIGSSIWGTFYDGTSFWTLSSGGLALRYEGGNADVTNPQTPEYWHLAYSWYDDAGTVHETVLGPTKMLTPSRRARYKLTAEDIPIGGSEDPNKIRWYAAKTTTTAAPARTSYKLIGTTAVSSLIVSDLVLGATTPPDPANNPNQFPATGFGRIASPGSNPDIELKGDGSWKLKGLSDGMQTYTTTWSTGATAVTLGNGVLVAKYKQVGKLVWFRIFAKVGSTTSFSSGQFRFTLPVAPAADSQWQTGSVTLWDNSAGLTYRGHFAENTNVAGRMTGTVLCDPTTAGAAIRVVGQATPFTWAVDDTIDIAGFYEAA